MGLLQYEYKWNHGREKEPSLQCGPMRSQTSQWRTSELLLELWKAKVPLKRIREQLGMLG
jgi:hypothetical protein